ncbi:MAG: glycolate oxidase subunit GlcF [Steroidobacteraceae bacterium]
MQTRLPQDISKDSLSVTAAGLIGRCVHCGFCNATCPTYQLLGDERDGPRGRIHLIKQMLEGDSTSASTQQHLDRCLTCRACESTCPSGVEYGKLVDLGREVLARRALRPWRERLRRRWLADFLTSRLFGPALRLGQWLRPLLPARLAARVPARVKRGQWPRQQHARRVLLLGGCVQPALSPDLNACTARVLDALGVEVIIAPDAGCCGALHQHLDQQSTARDQARRNIDAWWPLVEAGAEAVVFNATGCGTQLAEYGWLLRDDPAYAPRAARISELSKDVSAVLAPLTSRIGELCAGAAPERLAFHAPCSLQHGLKSRGVVESLLTAAGATLSPVRDSHLCCGSAGTYSLLQPELSTRLRDARLEALQEGSPTRILSANIGCMVQLGSAAPVPVIHWIQWLEERLR